MRQKRDQVAADIGGTHARLMCNGVVSIYLTKDFSNFEDFLKGKIQPGADIVVALAGPIQQGKVIPTNIPHWGVLDESILKNTFKANSFSFINDLVANAYGLEAIDPTQLHLLKRGSVESKDKALFLSPGTGFGKAFIYKGEVLPSEGGHVDFAPTNEEEFNLLLFLKEKYGHVSIERIVSGMALCDLKAFTKTKGDKIPELFFDVLARAIGNSIVDFLPDRVFLGGGLLPKVYNQINLERFFSKILDQGRFKKIVDQRAIFLVLDELTALKGANYFLQKMS